MSLKRWERKRKRKKARERESERMNEMAQGDENVEGIKLKCSRGKIICVDW